MTVAGKTMGWHSVDHHGDGRISLSLRAPKGENQALVASDPDKFFLPPHVAHHGYVGIRLDGADVDWDEVRELVPDAYRGAATWSVSLEEDDPHTRDVQLSDWRVQHFRAVVRRRQ